jgi:integrase/recombinase XerD
MSDSPLRRRMIEDMTVRNFVEKTRNDYIRHVRSFTAFLGRSPDTATADDLRRDRCVFIRSPRRRGQAASAGFRDRAPWR